MSNLVGSILLRNQDFKYYFDKPRKGEEEGLGTEKRVDLIRPEMERKLRQKDMKYLMHDNNAKGMDGPLVARFKN